jgi:hypothetical protein
MMGSLSQLFRQSHAVQQPPAAPPLHSQIKAPRLNQLKERSPQVGVANSLIKAGSKFTGLFRARQRDVGKHEQKQWHEDLMRAPGSAAADGQLDFRPRDHAKAQC